MMRFCRVGVFLTILCAFTVGGVATCAAGAPAAVTASDNPYLRRVLREEFALVYRTNEIDKQVFSALKHKLRDDSRIAEPGQPFQKSDVVSGKPLPWRRLVFAGHLSDLWIVCCEHGGIGYHHDLFVLSQQGSQWKLVFTCQGFMKEGTLPGLRTALQNGKLFPGSEVKPE